MAHRWTRALLAVAVVATMAGFMVFERFGARWGAALAVAGSLATLLLAARFVNAGEAIRSRRAGRRGRGQRSR